MLVIADKLPPIKDPTGLDRRYAASELRTTQSVVCEVADQIWLVSFMEYDIGFFDENENRIETAPNPFSSKVLPMSSV